MNKKVTRLFCIFVSLILYSFFASSSLAEDLSLKDLLTQIQSNQSKIKDMYAETTTTITSNIVMPGAIKKGSQKMVQKGKMWTKGRDKSKIEMLSPTKQVTITNGDMMAIINPETGQKFIQDLKKLREKSGGQVVGQSGGQMTLEKAMDYFDLSVRSQKTEDGEIEVYIIKGVPKEKNKFLSKMEFYINASRWVPVKILMYGPRDKLISRSEMEYEKISDIWIPIRNISDVNTPVGKMKVEMGFKNIKINKGISDKEFKI